MGSLAQIPAGGEPARSQDTQLISAVLRKDRKATAEFVARCSDWIYPFVWRRLSPCLDMVEDLMQEILISAWQSLSNFRGEADLRAWILGIARHKVEDYYRRRIREAELKDDDVFAAEPELNFRIEEHLDAAADRERVQKILARLPEAYGLALIWRYRDAQSLREMAELTGKTNSGKAICWIRSNATGTRLYTVNTGDSSVSVYDATFPLQPVEIEHLKLKGVGNPLQLTVDPRGDFLYVVTQRASASIPLGQGNTLHALRINAVTGKLADDSFVQVSVPPGTRPQGVAAVELVNR